MSNPLPMTLSNGAPRSAPAAPHGHHAAHVGGWSSDQPIDRRAVPRSPAPQANLAMAQETVRLRIHHRHPIVPAEGNRNFTYLVAKRALDIVGAAGLLILFSPLLLLVTVVLTVTTKGRPLYVQERIGYLGRRFPLLKFRTMRPNSDRLQQHVQNEKEGPIFKNRADPRVTRIGRILRRTSIDEAPQLVNVLAGHMSLVGPRPPVEKEVVQYEAWQRRRLAVKPGLTCLWQVSGRSEVGFVEWVRMDLWYVQNQGFWTDLDLLVRTPWSVMTCRGAY